MAAGVITERRGKGEGVICKRSHGAEVKENGPTL